MANAVTKSKRGMREKPIDAERKRIFITELKRHGVMAEAARVASPHLAEVAGGAPSGGFRRAARIDPVFASEVKAAIEQADAAIRMAIFERATIGVKKNQYFKGDLIGHDYVPSDRLLEILAKSKFPEFIEKRQVENINSTQARGWEITAADVRQLTTEQMESLQDLMAVIMTNRGEIDADEALELAEHKAQMIDVSPGEKYPEIVELEAEESRVSAAEDALDLANEDWLSLEEKT